MGISMTDNMDLIRAELARLEETKTYKYETALEGPQGGMVEVGGKKPVIPASNTSRGLSNHPAVKSAAIRGIREYGYGVASVRFLCGTQDIHRDLEKKIAKFIGGEDAIRSSWRERV